MITKWADAFEARVETDADYPGLISIYEAELHPPACVNLTLHQRTVVLAGLLKHLQHELDNFDGSWSDEQYQVYDAIVDLLEYLEGPR